MKIEVPSSSISLRSLAILVGLFASGCGSSSSPAPTTDAAPADKPALTAGTGGATGAGGTTKPDASAAYDVATGGSGGIVGTGGSSGTGGISGSAGSDGGTVDSARALGMDGGLADAPDAAAESSCEVMPTSPNFVRGYWLLFNAMNTMGPPYISCAGSKCVWDGSTMTVTLQEPTCSGAKLAGTFHSVTTDGIGNGTTQFTGTYDSATQLLSLVETSPVATSGIIVASQDTITYDPSTDELINGLSICSPPTAAGCSNVSPMVWSARRVVGDAGAGPGDAINGPG